MYVILYFSVSKVNYYELVTLFSQHSLTGRAFASPRRPTEIVLRIAGGNALYHLAILANISARAEKAAPVTVEC
jgi:hypothetical protein